MFMTMTISIMIFITSLVMMFLADIISKEHSLAEITIWMWIRPKIFSTNSLFSSFLFNCRNFPNFSCWNQSSSPYYYQKNTNVINFSMIMSTFRFILLIGLYNEWKQGAPNWAY